MNRCLPFLLLCLLGLGLLLPGTVPLLAEIAEDEAVVFFPTNAYLDADGETWVIPVHGWIFEREENSVWRRLLLKGVTEYVEHEAEEAEIDPEQYHPDILKERAWMFLVDNESGEEVEITIGRQTFRLNRSQKDGHFSGMVRVRPQAIGADLLDNWLYFKAALPESDHRIFQGAAHLVPSAGVSVISDIDDTLRQSHVTERKKMLETTFLYPMKAVPGMADVYREWARSGAVFHYVSGSPWQLYPSFLAFLAQQGFPRGSFHLRPLRVKKILTPAFTVSLEESKNRAIEGLLSAYPKRKFLLVGDATEKDPEIYAKIAKRHPEQILHLFIREIPNHPAGKKKALEALKELPESRWTLFREAEELLERTI